MDAKRLENCRQRLRQALPLIGRWLRRKAVDELVRDGSSEAIVMLAEAAERPDDDQFRRSLTETVGRGKAHQRALFYFLTGEWERYDSLDFDHTLLRAVYEAGDEDLRKLIATQARRAGRVEWIEVVTGGRQMRRLGEMTDDEWDAALAVLFDSRRWEELWRLAQCAPPSWSARILQCMNGSGWDPCKEDERAECAQLVRLAAKWKEPDLSSLIYCCATLTGHRANVVYLTISQDGRLLASGDSHGEIHFWSLPDGGHIKTHEECLLYLHSDISSSLNGRLEAHIDKNEAIEIWSLPDGSFIKTWEGQDIAGLLATSPDWGLWVGRGGHALRRGGKPNPAFIKKRLKGHQGFTTCLSISPDGRLLASGSNDGAIQLWSLPDGKLIKTQKELRAPLWCLSISPDGRLLAGGGGWNEADCTIRLWSLPDGMLIKTLENGADTLSISPDGRLLVSSSLDCTIQLWSLPDGTLIKTLEGARYRSLSFAISPDGRLLASGNWGTIQLWTLNPIRLCNLPVAKASQDDFEWVLNALRDGNIAESARSGLEFIAALMRRRRRHDIVVEETPQRIEIGEFDIEIED